MTDDIMSRNVFNKLPADAQAALQAETSMTFTLEEWSYIYAACMMSAKNMSNSAYSAELRPIAERISAMTKAAAEMGKMKQ